MKALAITLAVLAGTVTIAGSAVARPTQGAALSIVDASGPEGNSGTRPLSFRVTLSRANLGDTAVSVSYRTQNETARAAEDYVSARGELEFARGETTKTIDVQVNGDRAVEPDEFFSVVLFDPIGATIAQPGGTGTGTIQNDDRNVLPQACKCQSVKVRVAGFAAHGTTRLQQRAAEFWDVVFKADLTCRQGDVVDCAGFVRTASTPFTTQKPKAFTCRGTKCGTTSTHTLKVRIRVPRAEILQQHAAGRPLKKTLKLRAGCRGAPGVVKTFTLVLPKRN
jgi:Calx-beta domain